MTDQLRACREAFEKWAHAEGFVTERYQDGYRERYIDDMWRGWLAAIDNTRHHGRDDVSFSTVEKVVKALARVGHTFPESQEEQAARFESLVLDLCREVQSHFAKLSAQAEDGVAVAWLEAEPGVSLEQATGENGVLIHSMRVHVGSHRPAKAQEANGLFPLYANPPRAQSAGEDARDAAKTRCPTCDGPCDMFEEEGTFEIAYIYRSTAK